LGIDVPSVGINVSMSGIDGFFAGTNVPPLAIDIFAADTNILKLGINVPVVGIDVWTQGAVVPAMGTVVLVAEPRGSSARRGGSLLRRLGLVVIRALLGEICVVARKDRLLPTEYFRF